MQRSASTVCCPPDCCPPEDCPCSLQPTIAHLARSSLHRCLQRHGMSRQPDVARGQTDPPDVPRSVISISIAPRCAPRRASFLFAAIDRPSKFVVAQPVEQASRKTARAFEAHRLNALALQGVHRGKALLRCQVCNNATIRAQMSDQFPCLRIMSHRQAIQSEDRCCIVSTRHKNKRGFADFYPFSKI